MSQQSFIVQISRILIIIVSILLINCKGQDKDVERGNIKAKEVNLVNMTFLGVNKTDSIYTVYNKCDGGYPNLHFKQNEFYFYDPQEGANYIIKDIKNGNNKYVINTNGYYFIKGENIIKQNDTWFLEKKDDLLWTFQNKKWKKNIILSDSINLNKKKIAYKVQPCRECSENCAEDEKDNNLLGQWKTDCENPIGIMVKDDELTITVEPNQYYIHLTKIQDKTQKNIIKYKLKGLEGLGSKDIYSEAYFNDSEIATIKNLGNDKMEFNWLGFYNKFNKQRQYTEAIISNDNVSILKKCDE